MMVRPCAHGNLPISHPSPLQLVVGRRGQVVAHQKDVSAAVHRGGHLVLGAADHAPPGVPGAQLTAGLAGRVVLAALGGGGHKAGVALFAPGDEHGLGPERAQHPPGAEPREAQAAAGVAGRKEGNMAHSARRAAKPSERILMQKPA
jgi:hypothetical protein